MNRHRLLRSRLFCVSAASLCALVVLGVLSTRHMVAWSSATVIIRPSRGMMACFNGGALHIWWIDNTAAASAQSASASISTEGWLVQPMRSGVVLMPGHSVLANASIWTVPLWPLLLTPVAGVVWAMRRHDRRDRAGCAGCGYDVRGLTRGICPECGSPAAS